MIEAGVSWPVALNLDIDAASAMQHNQPFCHRLENEEASEKGACMNDMLLITNHAFM